MKRHEFLKVAEDGLEAGFHNPPHSAKPYTWWHWMNGNIATDGITRDLEAMQRVGIGGFHIFQVSAGIPKGPVDYGSSEWLQLLQHAAKEADRLGLEFAMHNCPGWSSSGGPWITPEFSMQQLVWSEVFVTGGGQVDITLPQPYTKLGYYRDAFVLAFPSLEGEDQLIQNLLSNVTSSSGPVDATLLTDGDLSSGVEVRPAGDQPAYLQLEFAEPFQARSIVLYSSALVSWRVLRRRGNPMLLEASDDGIQFRKVCDLDVPGGQELEAPAVECFPPVQAKYFRLVFSQANQISLVRLSEVPLIADWPYKANFVNQGGFRRGVPEPFKETGAVPEKYVVDPESILDITQYMDEQGRLNWEAPAGDWTVLRIGHTSIGVENHPAPDGGGGLECDKYSAAAMDFHFNHFFGKLLPTLAALSAKGLTGAVIDSYETGMQNWTARFPQEFQRRRGYDLRKYLPAMTGRVVGSGDTSDRFLWDVRRTQADMMADNYYGRFAKLCQKNGMKAYMEPYIPGPFEEMQIGSRVDVPMGEFWQGGGLLRSVKLAASIAHVNGKTIVGAESFTSQARWTSYPYGLKALGDFAYTQGLNKFIFHCFAHHPHPDATPGMTMGPWGWHFDRANTWFNQSTAWLDYAARCQYMLQQGLFVADLAYFTGEDAPGAIPEQDALSPAIPTGYDFDMVNVEAILNRMKVKNGRIVLPDGMSYRLLVLPDKTTTMTLELLRKVRDMVNQGMWLVGPKPEYSPSLSGYPESDEEVRNIADELWGDLNGTTVTERDFGKGRVFWGVPLRTVLDKRNVKPDFEFTSHSGNADINYIHRRVGDRDIYFVANRGEKSEDLVCRFRVEGKQPEFWNAVTGEIAPVDIYEMIDGGVRVPVRLSPAQSVFVVFRSPAPERSLQAVAKDGEMIVETKPFQIKEEAPKTGSEESFESTIFNFEPVKMPDSEEPRALELSGGSELLIWENGKYSLHDSGGQTSQVQVSGIGQPVEISGPWRVTFPPDLGAPEEIQLDKLISWTEHPKEGVKYFSGTATYSKQFNVPASAIVDGKRLFLDLGRVEVIAEVVLNGQNLGILWMPPFQVDITDAACYGNNDLEIKVTNLWPNRLIGDEYLPPENEYGEGGSGGAAIFDVGIKQLPDWYVKGEPKPPSGRVTFTTWKHYDKDDPLLKSGLIGPVRLRTAVRRAIDF